MRKLIFVTFLVLTAVSCRTPEQLIDKAIQRDPTILKDRTDTITMIKYEIDSVPYTIKDTTIWIKTITETKYDTIIPTQQIEIERRKTRLEIRKNQQLERLRLKMEERDQKRYAKIRELELKLEARNERQENRTDLKKERSENRQNWLIWFVAGIIAAIVGKIAIKQIVLRFF